MIFPAYPIYQRGQVPTPTGDAEADVVALSTYIGNELSLVQAAIPIRTTTTVTASYAVLVTDDIVLVDCTAGPIILTFPDPSRVQDGRWTVKKIDLTANNVTLVANIAGTAQAVEFDNGPAGLSAPYDALTLVSDGYAYWIIGQVLGTSGTAFLVTDTGMFFLTDTGAFIVTH